ncbi:tRNA (adenosine(37)-N6)-threonylcarbamoyltransferase complex ATPase subunit type 1 TsaE [Candidatus Saccharibacteria bacterium]|nr:tRNA (adenosine(37)-N6)-threonylcarbamoyltransferase complex ATPase subunit type 1 TsaE [Candidatus Saccharibacteria bacterium]NIV04257.1 tRNA (adenosine(37)-N6)-threonylcarbamoyltransferase complex ATPase subunit type 1 TsaE [Calditrichia bacterium]NIS38799.1 tRNA (adenosine(37)-N6)-threonylcarbamoyltransferase complex ATPase subunit type 1 TsaE [Candidatus Saccharibacteria bacterium]NIV72730.1 tRNA (adenosine(37)-N6)-threonylcarbamoyltransferase complex ATPase subunit type 1 TsaE [Calditric
MKKVIKSEHEMHAFARQVAKKIKPGDILALSGELGSGKTTFVKGLAKAMGITGHIISPTFVLFKPYKVKNQKFTKFVHVDAYRVEEAELQEVGIEDYFEDGSVLAIEWAEKIKKILPPGRTKWFRFSLGKKENERIVQF